MTQVRFFAAAEEAAGRANEHRAEQRLLALRQALVHDYPALAGILPRCAVLVDGVRHDGDTDLTGAETVDILPPFAGG
ncbi:MoaD/ThiS family protein [Microbacterium amylolyticum]|uniref:Molybdopterin converting factor small subunit n=1 Tax=Microbacterium amylolyticum TaxID=936337 RepID=A0ABS4ZFK8_9MICO|nr:MoaD/ThiS family protein [Microbacterium amylolyticum]MBP2435788.1 molybdopterin converting factor small subunit [Microbacterium amylolyticum]